MSDSHFSFKSFLKKLLLSERYHQNSPAVLGTTGMDALLVIDVFNPIGCADMIIPPPPPISKL